METGISVRYLNKAFGGFRLRSVSIEAPRGYITGVIGSNGSGKTTLLKCITGAYVPDSGYVEFGVPKRYGRIGIVCDECPYPPTMRVSRLSKVMSSIFDDWDDRRFSSLCDGYGIGPDSRVGTLSRGTRMKLQVAVMLSHGTDCLILDEPASGMDPESKEGLMDILRDYVSDEEHTVVISSNSISDLERIADQVVVMIDGEAVLCKDRISLMEEYGIVRAGTDEIVPEEHVVGSERTGFGSSYLVKDRGVLVEEHPELMIDDASLEDILLYLTRGRRRWTPRSACRSERFRSSVLSALSCPSWPPC